jgi:hypothetical protein
MEAQFSSPWPQNKEERMARLIGMITFVALVFLAAPLSAQQDTTAGGAGAEMEQADTAAMTGEMETETGGEMPTTGSTIPLVAVAGALAVAIGFGIRFARRS